jgi:hypothetical protein
MDNQANWILQPVCRWSSDAPQMMPQQLWRDTVTGATEWRKAEPTTISSRDASELFAPA